MQQEPTHHLFEPYENRLSDRFLSVRQENPPIGGVDGLVDLPFDLSHELRTSLAVLTLLCGNLDRLYERLGDEERRTMIQKMRKHTQRLNELVGDVLALGQGAVAIPS
jgi:signal transduction histidine kinase